MSKKSKRLFSNSDAQQDAEAHALERVAALLRIPQLKAHHPLSVGEGTVFLDGFLEDKTQVVMVEVNARVGKMRTATRNKVIKDAFKMLVLSKLMANQWRGKRIRCALVFVDQEARNSFGPKSWGNAAFASMEIESHVCPVTPAERKALEMAQRRQDLRFNA